MSSVVRVYPSRLEIAATIMGALMSTYDGRTDELSELANLSVKAAEALLRAEHGRDVE